MGPAGNESLCCCLAWAPTHGHARFTLTAPPLGTPESGGLLGSCQCWFFGSDRSRGCWAVHACLHALHPPWLAFVGNTAHHSIPAEAKKTLHVQSHFEGPFCCCSANAALPAFLNRNSKAACSKARDPRSLLMPGRWLVGVQSKLWGCEGGGQCPFVTPVPSGASQSPYKVHAGLAEGMQLCSVPPADTQTQMYYIPLRAALRLESTANPAVTICSAPPP